MSEPALIAAAPAAISGAENPTDSAMPADVTSDAKRLTLLRERSTWRSKSSVEAPMRTMRLDRIGMIYRRRGGGAAAFCAFSCSSFFSLRYRPHSVISDADMPSSTSATVLCSISASANKKRRSPVSFFRSLLRSRRSCRKVQRCAWRSAQPRRQTWITACPDAPSRIAAYRSPGQKRNR